MLRTFSYILNIDARCSSKQPNQECTDAEKRKDAKYGRGEGERTSLFLFINPKNFVP